MRRMNITTNPYQPSFYGSPPYASPTPPSKEDKASLSTISAAVSSIPPPTPSIERRQDLPEKNASNPFSPSPIPDTSPRADELDEQSTSQGTSPANSDGATAETTTQHGTKPVSELNPEELQFLDALQKADAEVRAHEMAHISAGGQYVTSGAQLEYVKGPDGQNYAVAGEVSIDTSPIPGDPQATLAKMRQIQQAALAPASPSSQDRKVASRASAMAAQALSELMVQQVKSRVSSNEEEAFGITRRQAADNYAQTNSAPSIHPTGNRLNIAV